MVYVGLDRARSLARPEVEEISRARPIRHVRVQLRLHTRDAILKATMTEIGQKTTDNRI